MKLVLRNKKTFNVFEYSGVRDYQNKDNVITLNFDDGSVRKFSAEEFNIPIIYKDE